MKSSTYSGRTANVAMTRIGALMGGLLVTTATCRTSTALDAAAAMDTLKKRADVGGRGIGAMGFCFGGHVTYLSACELPIAAAASFYGGGIAVGAPGNDGPPTIERTAKIRGKILCFFGDKDGYISADQVERIKQELTKHEIGHEVVVYPSVGHG